MVFIRYRERKLVDISAHPLPEVPEMDSIQEIVSTDIYALYFESLKG